MTDEQLYRTKAGETVDYIAWKHYGNQNPGTVEALFTANPELAQQPPELPAGIVIVLPAIEIAQPKKVVTLWQ